jgi:hypothetical protein
MKLEEVLPAMRAGRVAVDVEGSRWRLIDERFQVSGPSSPPNFIDSGPWITDGWTLEPEPKVEWPKGSIQWAAHESCASGHGMIRHRNKDSITAGGIPASRALEYAARMDGVLFSLGWEPVP